MKRLTGRTLRLGALAIAFALVWIGVSAMNWHDKSKVAKMTEKMKTVCVGRFLIDLPASAEVSLGRAYVDGFDIEAQAETEESFRARIAAREAELTGAKNELGRKSLELAQAINVNGFAGKIFMSGRWHTYGFEYGVRKDSEFVELNGYVHKHGISFTFTSKDYIPGFAKNLPKLISQLRLVGSNEIPTADGFCLDQGMLVDPLSAEQRERIVMFAALPGHPDIAIAFSTMAGLKPQRSLLARNAAAAAGDPFYIRAAFTTLREGARAINGLSGEELALRVRELNFTTNYTFDWEMTGKRDDVFAPLLTLELESGIRPRAGSKPVQSSLSEAAMVELWDKISSSIRVRRSQPPAAKQVPTPGPTIGAVVQAGDSCPASGWWQCSDGGARMQVLGGARQFIRHGQKVPQALLLPPQTIWEKVRGIQPSYESKTPTTWKLVDRRSRQRVAPRLPLADPTPAQPTIEASPQDEVPIGSVVLTGAVCPASGWWRCEEPNALDGARWFPASSLLPPATFEIAGHASARASVGGKSIQRRAAWRLVRRSPTPGQGSDGGQPEFRPDGDA